MLQSLSRQSNEVMFLLFHPACVQNLSTFYLRMFIAGKKNRCWGRVSSSCRLGYNTVTLFARYRVGSSHNSCNPAKPVRPNTHYRLTSEQWHTLIGRYAAEFSSIFIHALCVRQNIVYPLPRRTDPTVSFAYFIVASLKGLRIRVAYQSYTTP